MSPKRSGLSRPSAGNSGSPSSAMLSLPEEPRILKFRARLTKAGSRSFSSNSLVKVRFGSRFETTIFAWYSLPLAVATPTALPPRTITRSTGASVTISPPIGLERGGDRLRHRAHAAARESPRADRAVDVAHVVMQQHVGRARRVHAHGRADDAAAGEVRLDEIGLEIFAEEIRDAHRVEAHRVVDGLLAELRELLAEIDHFADVARPQRGRVRRRAQQQRTDELALAHHVGRVAVVRIARRARCGARTRGAARRGPCSCRGCRRCS